MICELQFLNDGQWTSTGDLGTLEEMKAALQCRIEEKWKRVSHRIMNERGAVVWCYLVGRTAVAVR